MSAWPSIVCNARRSAPPASRWVAKAWRRTWGLTRVGSIPALPASFRLVAGRLELDPRDPGFFENPYPTYAALNEAGGIGGNMPIELLEKVGITAAASLTSCAHRAHGWSYMSKKTGGKPRAWSASTVDASALSGTPSRRSR